jgi:hypothetical protein
VVEPTRPWTGAPRTAAASAVSFLSRVVADR